MKVLHVIPGIEQISGGPSQAINGICNALTNADISSFVITTRDPLNRYKLIDYRDIENNILFCDRWKLEKYAFSLALKRWLSDNVSNFNIVHIHSLFNFPSYIAAYIARKKKIPYVIRPAGTFNTWRKTLSLKKKIGVNYIEKQNFKCASAIHATSKQEIDCLIPYFNKDIITEIPLGITLPKRIDQNFKSDASKELRILFLSRLNQKKNIPILLLAIKKLIDRNIPVSLRIAGNTDPGKEKYEQELKMKVEELNIGKYASFIGFVDGYKKEQEFRNTDVFILPSYDENFGIAVLEALSYGVPVIISERVALAEEVQTYEAGFVVACNDADSITTCVMKLHQNNELLSSMSMNSLLLADSFSWESTAKSLIDLYTSILRR